MGAWVAADSSRNRLSCEVPGMAVDASKYDVANSVEAQEYNGALEAPDGGFQAIERTVCCFQDTFGEMVAGADDLSELPGR